ncbi:hypothetical protein [Bacillus thuringiensis]|uniref:hypothetical protein n=1 Tax=Bacillus thuringiensis TaxID=1428 RepID=UPI0015810673|nr:hypothetical protein [Bacillus thuringiensis]NUH91351.1 hypothetical protein [Bacillus thuringiensis]NUH96672.1 hypothetical protein [Bacillus thuringiensis]NUI02022.1 hypothetical protein [Bacillus thuringiensis]NUI07202.1 hypothetical protein [Bacillus thuringiensis]NUI15211.1 hypothetical protein [Bacillus thuringiensis]
MKKRLGIILAAGVGLSLGVSNSALAQVNSVEGKNNVVENKLESNSLQGVSSTNNSTPEKIKNTLIEMGFTNTEIATMQDTLKVEIVKNGGKKVSFTSLKDSINSQKNSVQYAVKEPEAVMENGLNFSLFALYEGTEGSNHMYRIYASGYWLKIPYLKTNDTIGIVWGDNVTAVNNSDKARQSWFTPDEFEEYLTADRSSKYGTQWKVPFKEGATMNGAYTSQKVAVPTSLTGKEVVFGSGFSHPWLKQQQTIPFKFGPGSIDFNGVKGYNYNLKYSVTVGSPN